MSHHDAATLLSLDPAIRYVALYRGGELYTAQRPDLADASSSESDRYEELIVNPVLLSLSTRCGDAGAGYVIVRYGHFQQLVMPLPDGHASVAIEAEADAVRLAAVVARALGAG